MRGTCWCEEKQMSERINAADGGTLLALRPLVDDVSGENHPEVGTVLLYYKNGVGFRVKKFGEAAEALSSEGGGSITVSDGVTDVADATDLSLDSDFFEVNDLGGGDAAVTFFSDPPDG